MAYKDLSPAEKMYCAIFGEPADPKPWLSDEGVTTLKDVLAKSMPSRNAQVLCLRFGLEPITSEEMAKRPQTPWHNSCSRTLDEVKVYFGVSRERIRQIEAKSLRLLRHPARSRQLKPYLPGSAV